MQSLGPLKIQLLGRVLEGVVGIACTSESGSFLREIQVGAPNRLDENCLGVQADEICHSIILRNCSPQNQASIVALEDLLIERIAPKNDALVPHFKVSEDELMRFVARSPGGPRLS